MQTFDLAIISFLQTFTHRSMTFDALVVYIARTNLIKGGVIMALFWWAWFKEEKEHPAKREYLLFGLGLSVFAVALARVLALSLPFRERLMHNLALHFQLPYTMDPTLLDGWSSFPSDHAVVFSCLVMTLWFVSRPLGIAAAVHAIFIVFLPRIYTGIHYPTDILGGMLIGGGIASLISIERLRIGMTRMALEWSETYAGPFYAILFYKRGCQDKVFPLNSSARV